MACAGLRLDRRDPICSEMKRMRRPLPLGLVAAALVVLILIGLPGCGDDGAGEDRDDDGTGVFVPNMPPSVAELSATTPHDLGAVYEVEFSWTAYDADGRVDHFLYCVDPEDLAGTGATWHTTKADSVTLTFQDGTFEATEAMEEFGADPRQIGGEYHAFVIKAVDDMGAESVPDYVAFNSSTICPRTSILAPPPVGELGDCRLVRQEVGLWVTFYWSGEDPDGVTTGAPVGYMYKLKDVPRMSDCETIATSLYEDQAPWIEVGGDTRSVTLDLVSGTDYGFAVRSIDETGAIEPMLVINGNLFWFGTRYDTAHFPFKSSR